MASEIVGRDAELEALRAFVERASDAPRGLVLEGEPGIGKSTLWRAALEHAREQGMLVLSTRPAEAERGLAFAGLGDLLEGVLEDVLPELPPPRRRALAIAMLLEETSGRADSRALGVAVQDALQLLAGRGRLVLAVDDVQWLDPSTAGALAFALRRLRGDVAVVVARRVADGLGASSREQAPLGEAFERLRLGPLSAGAIQRVLQDELGRTFPRPTLLRIHEASGGNPFYALEVASALGTDVDPTQPLPVPETLEELVRARLTGLPEDTRCALVLTSALGSASPKLLAAAGVGIDALEPALAARVLERADGGVRFTHPLLSSVLYQGLSGDERRRAHLVLARVVVDPLERARHLALATAGPAPSVAAELEQAASLAAARGAGAMAAELAEHALRLTPLTARVDEHRRTIAAGRLHLAAGEVERARALGRALDEERLEGDRRVEALIFLAELELGRLRERIARRREALHEQDARADLRLLLHQRLALELRFFEGRAAAETHARAAFELAAEVGDDALRAGAQAVLAMLRFIGGHPDAPRLAEEAHALAGEAGDDGRLVEATFCLAHVLVWSGELARARELLDSLDESWRERDERVSAQALWYVSLVELAAGQLAAADGHAERARELAALYARDEADDPQSIFPSALTAAFRGELEVARALAERGQELAESQEALLPGFAAVSGVVESWGGAASAAIARFEVADRIADAAGWVDPGLRWWRPEHVEALLELGRADDAAALLAPWERSAKRLRRQRALAQAARCRGLVAAGRGEVERAQAELAEAITAQEAASDPLGAARALLALGAVRRRARQKRAARAAIERAITLFEECGAAGWAARARAELGRIGGRRREEDLTAAERRVAALVAEGRTNREVAAALFLGERTVESHLSRIYGKLGVRSRTELARVYGRGS